MVSRLDGFKAADGAPVLGQRVLRPRQQVEDALRKAVLGGLLQTGERLPAEAELARQFSVSRPTIREALSALETQGLIRKVPGAGGGSFVQAVNHESLGVTLRESMHNLVRLGSLSFDEVAMVRQFLELRKIVAEQKTRSVDDPAVPELDAQFHTAIARMSGNRVLASLVYALHRESEPVSYLDLSPEVGRKTVSQHQRIVKAIADGDAAAAEDAITEHLTYLRKHIKALVSQENRERVG
jgi:GntR family transcriptional regulator, transcriptional repressor for pyruvate dehydrogenase complex